MEWREISHSEYHTIFSESWTIFHSSQFNELNKNKAESIHYFWFKGKNADYGIVFGEREGKFLSPFSSPFGGLEFKGTFDEKEVVSICHKLSEKLKEKSRSCRITFPPLFYNKDFIKSAINGFKAGDFSTAYTDINFHLELDNSGEPEFKMERNAKKNLNKGLKTDHRFLQATTLTDQERVYSVIQRNRNEKGYPLKLTFDDLISTGKLVPIDYYLLECDSTDGAAAIVFRISANVAMVVYWGHLQEFSDFRPINLLAYYLYKEYAALSFSQLDIGPSSEYGVLNEGLAAFKDSLGCKRTEKITLTLDHE